MPPTAPTWDPQQYLRHAGHRARAFVDLLAHVPEPPGGDRPRIADLGCGPGNVTRLLAARWPGARITGYDNSPEMLDKAHVDHEGPTSGGGRIDFASADLRTWAPAESYDLIVSNATFQWVPGHLDRFPVWVDALVPGGTFAFQVPGSFDLPSHRLMRELARSERWRDRLGDTLRHDDAVHMPATYLAALADLGCEVDAWETTYVHLLQGEDAVLDWVTGTGLRPILTELGDDAGPFVAEYRTALREAYPATAHGTAFPFRRIFVVAQKPEAGGEG
ncbi:trans-aconitate methyltransferase [Streptomyces sp. JV178]|uniref:trans-aconitate 2-methyltransferase n=1 Tax=Streptomyces sp. JV178 TaxID=858632 RepID=UPI000C1B3063|nr:trans-aconitate 2-methyltransferase [Streptomyces sp. JV178]PIM66715.1 trans-aconitate methyltransferase [Streptomyces sp. JV178]